MFGYDAAHTSSNPFESTVGIGNVASLQQQWTAAVCTDGSQRPAVVNGVIFVGSTDDQLVALDANGVQNCSGTPKTCLPLWTGLTGGAIDFSSPAVADGIVYVGAEDGKLYAFDANGTTNCSGTPTTCAPLWTAQTGRGIESSPTIANGRVFVGSDDGSIYAFDAAGVTNCLGTPKICAPLWSVKTGGAGTPAISAGVVYVSGQSGQAISLYALDAATGTTLWTANNQYYPFSDPVVANGDVYVAATDGTIFAFDSTGTTNCAGTPKVCSPLWTGASGAAFPILLSVANNVLYMGSTAFSLSTQLYAFDALGVTNCSGTPKVCSPLWTAYPNYSVSAPTIANGVIYAGANGIYAYDASGMTGCTGSPKVCNPLWTTPGSTYQSTGSPTISNGHLYATGNDRNLYVYALPG
jgi:outer membrane protein assembly factor BamB